MIVIGSNTSDNGPSCFTEDVSHLMELRQNRQLALLKRSAKNETISCFLAETFICPIVGHWYPSFRLVCCTVVSHFWHLDVIANAFVIIRVSQ